LVCEACGGIAAMDAHAQASRENDPIPWKDRYGMAAGGLAIVVMVLFFARLIGHLSGAPTH
jgi:hypothetical protein